MNLHRIVSGAISAVNAPVLAQVYESQGYTTGPDGTQSPAYALPVQTYVQAQAMSGTDLKKVDGLNLQGVMRAVYLDGRWRGAVRVEVKGGDKLVFNGQTWLVAMVLENWRDWTKLAVVLQNGS